MTLGEMIARVRRQLPSAVSESITNDDIRFELNRGVDECNQFAQIYKGYTEFQTVPEQQIYSLASVVPNFIGTTKNYVRFVQTGGSYKWLFPKTIRWLDLYVRNWIDLPSGEPQWYWIEGDDIGFYPKPSTASTVRVYHLKKSTPMDNLNNYPWTNTTAEVGALKPFDDAVVSYARWRLSPAVGKEGEENPLFKSFLFEVNRAAQQTKRRKDMISDQDYRMRPDVYQDS